MANITATKPKDLQVGDMVVLDEQVWDVEEIEPGNVYTLKLTKHGNPAQGRIFNLGCRASIGTTTDAASAVPPAADAAAAEETPQDAQDGDKLTKAQAGRARLAALESSGHKILLPLSCVESDIVEKVQESKRFELEDAFVGPFSPEVLRIRDTEQKIVFMLYTFKKDPRFVSVPKNGYQPLRELMGDRWSYEHFATPSDAHKSRVAARKAQAEAEAAEKKAAKEKARKETEGK